MFQSIRNFIYKTIFATLFFLLSAFIFISLLTYNENDPGFGKFEKTNDIHNYLGVYGANVSSFLNEFIGLCSFLVPIFLFFQSVKIIRRDKIVFLILRFVIFFTSLVLSAVFLNYINLNSGLLGDIFYKIFSNQGFVIGHSFLFAITLSFVFIIGIILYFISLALPLRYLKSLKFLFAPFTKAALLILYKIKNREKQQSKPNEEKIYRQRSRIEPVIDKKDKHTPRPGLKMKNERGREMLNYKLPEINLLNKELQNKKISKNLEILNKNMSHKLEEVLQEYNVEGKIKNFESGPVITLFEFLPAPGIKASKIVGLSEDIARAMSSLTARISSQPGKNSIGIEIPNKQREAVNLYELFDNKEFLETNNDLVLALGKDISGKNIFANLNKMPHLLIAGTTGSGKSVGINTMILSLLYRFTPNECKLILIDPKMLELSIYQDIPHLLTPVVTDPNKAVYALKWIVREMENRYKLMSEINVKSLESYNEKISKTLLEGRKIYRKVQTGIDSESRQPIIEKREMPLEKMPLIVVVVDEMADLMMVAGKEVENLIQRLAQMARASGIHLITATQRPSVDVITGTIKANFPCRISYKVASKFDSRTILNEMGAEQLLGSGDMLFLENGEIKRLHGAFISEKEIERIVRFIKDQHSFSQQKDITLEEFENNDFNSFDFEKKDSDELYDKAVSIVVKNQKVSTSFIQRYLQIGYNRAARIVEQMEEEGLISEASHSGKRTVIKKS